MKSLLVTGGAGFIGSCFVRYWRDRYPDDRIVVLDLLTYAGNRANLDGVARVSLVVGDICDQRRVTALLREHDIDTIVNFAAESHVDRSISGPDAFLRTNIVGTQRLLEAARTVWLSGAVRPHHRFHQVSTDEVFGSLGPADPAFHEATPFAPNSPYSASKAAADHLVRAYHHSFGLATSVSHCSNNYGPYQFPEKLIPLFLINLLEGRPLPIYGDGMNVRDWLFVEDHCRGIDLILQRGGAGTQYNIGGGAELTNMAVIDTLCALVDRHFARSPGLAACFPDAPAAMGRASASLKHFVIDRPGHDRRYAIDDRRIRAELGYRARHDFQQGFAKTVAWYLANVDWWRAVADRGAAARGSNAIASPAGSGGPAPAAIAATG
ncbi:dTDP-glucose 4,6-dehydratase [Hephaestia sp. GCM10023244]|uniref:dTDP-glucose 4,6-dehydratase n=1 Tax=unclassified Hephaestia TaxID=2631281 RepID=UPI00207714CB|nr:dTDP-glucose 4,6-dehydratase [Hephaestia sp. MAHUQ-44]MCM8729777.1 dTDP-glucose 4,6-dehydratase [Hephaestia sp. MAHUQ-44]